MIDSYRLASMVPSGILNRSIGSANNFRAPVAIGSSIYDGMNMAPAHADYQRPTSLASNEGYGIQSAIFNPYNVSLDNTNYMGNATNIMSGLLDVHPHSQIAWLAAPQPPHKALVRSSTSS